MKCLKCDQEKELHVSKVREDKTKMGFCRECWEDTDQSGECFNCGVKEDLFINAIWGGKPIEHICGHCRATLG